MPLFHPGQLEECEQVCLCLGGSQRVLLAVSLRLGGAPNSRLFA